jgi:hypothetical protein
VLPADPFGRSRLPADFSREHRVQLLTEAADALLAGKLPSDEARLFLAGGLRAWLHGPSGADLLADYWRVRPPPGKRSTAPRLAQQAEDVNTPQVGESEPPAASSVRTEDTGP